MRLKRHFNFVLVLVSVATVLLPPGLHSQSVSAGGGVVFRPPFSRTYRVTAYFDHQSPNYAGDGYIWTYNGERVASSLANRTGEPYPYDGHDGWDWSMTDGTDVLAVAGGQVVLSTDSWQNNESYGRVIIIAHDNNYYSMYAHLAARLVEQGSFVTAGQHIAESGHSPDVPAHLHFGVRHGGYNSWSYATDPFGWRGTQRDPLFGYNQKESSCLWAGVPGDAISCADIIVEDDGAGWSQYGAWAQSTAGNGFRQHWTYVWVPADYWAKWTPPVPYQGYYKAYAFIPAVNATTTNARYEVHHLSGTTVVPISQYNVSDAWASLGTFALQPSASYVQLYDYTGEPSRSRQIAADAIKFSASIVYLPEVRNLDQSWLSSIVIRNNSASSAQAAINYYNSTGGPVSYDPVTIAGNGYVVRLPPYGFTGLAVVVASSDVAVIVRDQNGDELTEYNGILASGGSLGWEQVGSTLYAPVVKNAYSGRSSRLLIANAGSTATTAYVQYYDSGGNAVGGTVSLPLATNGSGRVYPDNCTVNLCSAKIWSSNSQSLAVIALERTDGTTNNRSMHNAFSAGATRNTVPVVKNNYGGQTTGVTVQNLSAQSANVSLTCYDGLSSLTYACGTQNNLPSMATAVFYMGTAGLPNPFLGSAVVNATQPVASLIYESGDPYKLCTNADLSGTTTAYAPEIYGNYGGQAWNSGITVQNVGSGDATVTVTYYWQDGGQVTPSYSCTIAQNRMCTFSYWSGNLPGSFYGSAKITSAQPIAAVVNTAHTGSGDTKASYTASNR